jgi:hypothetical protein
MAQDRLRWNGRLAPSGARADPERIGGSGAVRTADDVGMDSAWVVEPFSPYRWIVVGYRRRRQQLPILRLLPYLSHRPRSDRSDVRSAGIVAGGTLQRRKGTRIADGRKRPCSVHANELVGMMLHGMHQRIDRPITTNRAQSLGRLPGRPVHSHPETGFLQVGDRVAQLVWHCLLSLRDRGCRRIDPTAHDFPQSVAVRIEILVDTFQIVQATWQAERGTEEDAWGSQIPG